MTFYIMFLSFLHGIEGNKTKLNGTFLARGGGHNFGGKYGNENNFNFIVVL